MNSNGMEENQITNDSQNKMSESKDKSAKEPLSILPAVLVIIIGLVVVFLIDFLASGVNKSKVGDLRNQAEECLREGEYQQAADCYKRIVRYCPKETDGYIRLAGIYNTMTEYKKAERILKKANRKVAKEDRYQIESAIAEYSKAWPVKEKVKKEKEKKKNEVKIVSVDESETPISSVADRSGTPSSEKSDLTQNVPATPVPIEVSKADVTPTSVSTPIPNPTAVEQPVSTDAPEPIEGQGPIEGLNPTEDQEPIPTVNDEVTPTTAPKSPSTPTPVPKPKDKTPTSTPTPTPVKKPGKGYETLAKALQTASDKEIIVLKTKDKKQYISFGSYKMGFWDSESEEVKKDSKKKELLWEVLEYSPEKESVLVICRNIITFRPYNSKSETMTWEKSSLRKWLNDDFIDSAFSSFERKMIVTTTISNKDNKSSGISGGKSTKDKIFLLSLDEVNKYFSADKYTASDERIRKSSDGSASWWWLRSPGLTDVRAACISDSGTVSDGGSNVSVKDNGVVPVMWINLNP